MNTTTVELVIHEKDMDKVLEWNKQNDGPHFIKEDKEHGYFINNESFKEYYDEKYDDGVVFMTVIPVYMENTLEDHLCKLAFDINVDLKCLMFYQDPGSGEARGWWFIC